MDYKLWLWTLWTCGSSDLQVIIMVMVMSQSWDMNQHCVRFEPNKAKIFGLSISKTENIFWQRIGQRATNLLAINQLRRIDRQ